MKLILSIFLFFIYSQSQSLTSLPFSILFSHKDIASVIEKNFEKSKITNQFRKDNDFDYSFIKKVGETKIYSKKGNVFLEMPVSIEGRKYYSFFKRFFFKYDFKTTLLIKIDVIFEKDWQIYLKTKYYPKKLKTKYLKLVWGDSNVSMVFFSFLLKRSLKKQIVKSTKIFNDKLIDSKLNQKITDFLEKSYPSFLIHKDYSIYLNNNITEVTHEKLYSIDDKLVIDFLLKGNFSISLDKKEKINKKNVPKILCVENSKENSYLLSWKFDYDDFSTLLNKSYLSKKKFYYKKQTNSYITIKNLNIGMLADDIDKIKKKIIFNGDFYYFSQQFNTNPFKAGFFQKEIKNSLQNMFEIKGTPYFDTKKQMFSLMDMEKKFENFNFVFAFVFLNSKEKIDETIKDKINLDMPQIFNELKKQISKKRYIKNGSIDFKLFDVQVEKMTFDDKFFEGEVLMDYSLYVKIDISKIKI